MPRRSGRPSTMAATTATCSSLRQRVRQQESSGGRQGRADDGAPRPGPSDRIDRAWNSQRSHGMQDRSRGALRHTGVSRCRRRRERAPSPERMPAQQIHPGEAAHGECQASSDESVYETEDSPSFSIFSSNRVNRVPPGGDATSESESSDCEGGQYIQPRNPFDHLPPPRRKNHSTHNPPKRRRRNHDAPMPMLETLLSIHLDNRIKRKIWRGDFVDFSKLLPSAGSSGEDQGRVAIDPATGLLIWKNSVESRRISSTHTWLDAFFVFMDVVLERFPNMARQLLHYASIIRRLSRVAGFAWLRYDTEFRQAIRFHDSLSWMKKDPEIYDRCVDYVRQAEVRQPRSFRTGAPAGGAAGGSSGGICHAFNREAGCKRNNCSFRHSCKKCGRDGHGQSSCRAPQVANPQPPPRPRTQVAQTQPASTGQ